MSRILVVDDMPIFREPLQVALESEGYTVDVAGDARGAAECIARNRPDLVLLDLGLPVVDGIAVLRQIRAEAATRDIAVVVLSAETQRTRIVEAAKLGISGYLLKHDFSLTRMLEEVVRVLRATPGAETRPAAPAATAPPLTLAAPPAATNDAAEQVVSRDELTRLLRANQELRGFSPVVTQVMKLASERTSSLDAIAQTIRQDPGLSLKVLKIANSSIYSRGDRVDTVLRAVTRIGTESIRQAVCNIAIIERFSLPAFNETLSIEQFWEHSIGCGLIAAESAGLAHEDREAAFTAGLLHDVGRIVLAESVGDRYVATIARAKQSGQPLEAIERQVLGTTHAELIAELLTSWNFPKQLTDPVLHHHDELKLTAPRPKAELHLSLADRLAHALLIGRSGNDLLYPIEAHCRALGLDRDEIKRIASTARSQTDETKYALLSASGTHPWPREIDRVRELLGRDVRPKFLSAAPDLDVLRLMLESLDLPTDGPTNVLLLHLHGPRDGEKLAREVIELECHSANASLPVVVVLANPRITLPVELERRMIAPALVMPLSVDALCGQLRQAVTPRRAAA